MDKFRQIDAADSEVGPQTNRIIVDVSLAITRRELEATFGEGR
jgi:hypothetical protein